MSPAVYLGLHLFGAVCGLLSISLETPGDSRAWRRTTRFFLAFNLVFIVINVAILMRGGA